MPTSVSVLETKLNATWNQRWANVWMTKPPGLVANLSLPILTSFSSANKDTVFELAARKFPGKFWCPSCPSEDLASWRWPQLCWAQTETADGESWAGRVEVPRPPCWRSGGGTQSPVNSKASSESWTEAPLLALQPIKWKSMGLTKGSNAFISISKGEGKKRLSGGRTEKLCLLPELLPHVYFSLSHSQCPHCPA